MTNWWNTFKGISILCVKNRMMLQQTKGQKVTYVTTTILRNCLMKKTKKIYTLCNSLDKHDHLGHWQLRKFTFYSYGFKNIGSPTIKLVNECPKDTVANVHGCPLHTTCLSADRADWWRGSRTGLQATCVDSPRRTCRPPCSEPSRTCPRQPGAGWAWPGSPGPLEAAEWRCWRRPPPPAAEQSPGRREAGVLEVHCTTCSCVSAPTQGGRKGADQVQSLDQQLGGHLQSFLVINE